jgi:hypothetical protein
VDVVKRVTVRVVNGLRGNTMFLQCTGETIRSEGRFGMAAVPFPKETSCPNLKGQSRPYFAYYVCNFHFDNVCGGCGEEDELEAGQSFAA